MLYWIWLATKKGLGCSALQKLLLYFSSPEEIHQSSNAELRLAGLRDAEIQALSDRSLDRAREILSRCFASDIRILTYQDAAYPTQLRNIPDPPIVLYYVGALPPMEDEPLVAVVASRKASLYGLSCARRLGHQIALCGGIVVSGVAAGGDSMAMLGALSSGRPVIGVLGCGVDVVYPKSNRRLYEDIRRRGCLISEYPPGTPPLARHFPARNRIISGLSLGVVVVEAPEKSGALITARLALEQGRDLFVVPGNIGLACCAGSNRLLKEGAFLVESGWDVMQEYASMFPGRVSKQVLDPHFVDPEPVSDRGRDPVLVHSEEKLRQDDKKSVDIPVTEDYIDVQAVLGQVSEDERQILLSLRDPRHVDELVAACGFSAGRVLASLTLLEIKQYVRRLPGNRYELAKRS